MSVSLFLIGDKLGQIWLLCSNLVAMKLVLIGLLWNGVLSGCYRDRSDLVVIKLGWNWLLWSLMKFGCYVVSSHLVAMEIHLKCRCGCNVNNNRDQQCMQSSHQSLVTVAKIITICVQECVANPAIVVTMNRKLSASNWQQIPLFLGLTQSICYLPDLSQTHFRGLR